MHSLMNICLSIFYFITLNNIQLLCIDNLSLSLSVPFFISIFIFEFISIQRFGDGIITISIVSLFHDFVIALAAQKFKVAKQKKTCRE